MKSALSNQAFDKTLNKRQQFGQVFFINHCRCEIYG